MIKELFVLKNKSMNDALYLENNEYITLPKNSEIIVAKRPQSYTDNIIVSPITRDVPVSDEEMEVKSRKHKN